MDIDRLVWRAAMYKHFTAIPSKQHAFESNAVLYPVCKAVLALHTIRTSSVCYEKCERCVSIVARAILEQ